MMTGSKGERGGWDRERSANQDLISGRPKPNTAICRRAAHEAIGSNINIFICCFGTHYSNKI